LEVDQVSAWHVTIGYSVISLVVDVSEREGNVREGDVLLSLSVRGSEFNHDELVNCDACDDGQSVDEGLVYIEVSVAGIEI
jgi:hypothetical protein